MIGCYIFDLARRRQWHPTPVLLPRKSHGWRSLVGCTPWGRWGSDTTEQLHFHFSLSCIGEGNGNPLQHSCLENPRDGGAWWAAVSGVTQSRTRLKWLSSSSIRLSQASLVAQLVKNLPAMWETWVRSLGWEDPLEKGKAAHSSILAWSWTWLSGFHLLIYLLIRRSQASSRKVWENAGWFGVQPDCLWAILRGTRVDLALCWDWPWQPHEHPTRLWVFPDSFAVWANVDLTGLIGFGNYPGKEDGILSN